MDHLDPKAYLSLQWEDPKYRLKLEATDSTTDILIYGYIGIELQVISGTIAMSANLGIYANNDLYTKNIYPISGSTIGSNGSKYDSIWTTLGYASYIYTDNTKSIGFMRSNGWWDIGKFGFDDPVGGQDPTGPTHLTTRSWVEGLVTGGIQWKKPVNKFADLTNDQSPLGSSDRMTTQERMHKPHIMVELQFTLMTYMSGMEVHGLTQMAQHQRGSPCSMKMTH